MSNGQIKDGMIVWGQTPRSNNDTTIRKQGRSQKFLTVGANIGFFAYFKHELRFEPKIVKWSEPEPILTIAFLVF